MRNIIRTISLAVIAAVFTFAHGGFEHVMGTVTKATVDKVSVQTQDGKVVEVGLTPKTTYTRDEKKATAADMKVGERVVIDATEEGKKLTAASVKLGTAAAAKAATGHDEHKH